MPSHRGLSSPTKEDYRICLLVDRHWCPALLSFSLSSYLSLSFSHFLIYFLSFSFAHLLRSLFSPVSVGFFCSLLPDSTTRFLSPERNAMATLRGTKFRRKFLRKSHCQLSRTLIWRTYRPTKIARSIKLSRFSTRHTSIFCHVSNEIIVIHWNEWDIKVKFLNRHSMRSKQRLLQLINRLDTLFKREVCSCIFQWLNLRRGYCRTRIINLRSALQNLVPGRELLLE